MSLEIARLKENAILPVRATPNSAGLDLFSTETVTIDPGKRCLIGTGIAMALAPWHVGFICPRSGMALRDGITILNRPMIVDPDYPELIILNAPGTIDPDYRGEVGIILANTGDKPYRVEAGARIAQLVIVPFASPRIVEVDALQRSKRGKGGFGSTGT
jgi:dUTP pyrophosphatase